ncbi:MAG: hypothetical protein SFX73_06660 [Kofleriaceae bacterium]|nr:hypothetical protein [Kofleriaceae bacterium]
MAVLVGAESAGAYAIALLPTTILRSIGGIVQNNLAPTTSHLISEGDFERARKLLVSGAFWNGAIISVPAGLAIGLSRDLLSLWFGPEHGAIAPLAATLLAFVGINSCAGPMFIASVARNRVRVPAAATLLSSLLGIGLAAFLASIPSVGMTGIAIATSLAITIKHTIFTPIYTRRLIGGRLRSYYAPIARVAAIGLSCAVAAQGAGVLIGAHSLMRLVASLALCLPVVAGALIAFAPREERQRAFTLAARVLARVPSVSR